MNDRSSRKFFALGFTVLAAACADRPEVQRSVAQVQRAVGEGAQGALAERPTPRQRLPSVIEESANLVQNAPGLMGVIPAIAPASALPAGELPAARPDGDSVAFDPDRNHQDIATARGSEHVGVAWHDAGEGMWFARTDRAGHGVGAPVQIRALVADEEGLSAPAVVAAGDAFGVAWVDAENGRVRFQVVGADGALRGASTIIHDGLADPRGASLVYNGREFGLAAQLGEGVYFTRVDAQGRRLDAGQLIAEGERVDGLEAVRWDGRAYSVAFSVSHDGAVEHRDQRVAASRLVASRSPRVGSRLRVM